MIDPLLVGGLVIACFVAYNIGGATTGPVFGPVVGAGVISKTVAGGLISLGIYEYIGGGHDHEHADHDHGRGPGRDYDAGYGHEHLETEGRTLWNVGLVALVLGFAHEEPIPSCSSRATSATRGSSSVIPSLSTVTAAVLVLMGLAFILGLVG